MGARRKEKNAPTRGLRDGYDFIQEDKEMWHFFYSVHNDEKTGLL